MNSTRTQLTLFVEDEYTASVIETVRKKFNPEQYALIGCHVTLCREDELEQMEKVLHNLEDLDQDSIVLEFGHPIRFSAGDGVLLPAMGDDQHFQRLRASILKGLIAHPRKQEPHITLMHPRNSTCTDEIFAQITKINFSDRITFRKISLIEQELGKKWRTLQEFDLNAW